MRHYISAEVDFLTTCPCTKARIGILKKQTVQPDEGVMRDQNDRDPDLDQGIVTETEKKLKKPSLYKVLLHNDDYTTMEFVVYVLQNVFRLDASKATQIMLHVHRQGAGVAGVYTYEVAEAKVSSVDELAKKHEFPLKCSMEEA